MEIIEINAIKNINFIKELKKIPLKNTMRFKINSSLMLNIDILFYYLKIKKIKNIILLKNNNKVDILALRKFIVYIQKYYLQIIKDFSITFEEISDEELYSLLGERNYLNYCYYNNITPIWNEKLLQKEKKKIDANKELLKYDTLKYLITKQKVMPYSKFTFPNENNKDRFIFHFSCHSEEIKNETLTIIKNIKEIEKKRKYYNPNIDNSFEKLEKLISSNIVNNEIIYYLIGFSYIKNKLIRISLYSYFGNEIILKNKIKTFILKKHYTKIQEKLKNVWYYGIDYYEDKEEIKIYDEPYKFKEKLNNEILNNIFQNKPCVKVLKYKDNQKVNLKFEFEYAKGFTTKDKKILKQNNLFDKKYKILSIYIKNGEIIKNIKYNL